MFGFARRARAEATRSFFVKLPWSAEFLRVNAAGLESRLLDDWLQAGLAALQAVPDWERRFDAMPAAGFRLNFAASERTLVGAVSASHDASGRRYPSAAFAAFDARSLGRALPVSPLAFEASLRTAAAVLQFATDALAPEAV